MKIRTQVNAVLLMAALVSVMAVGVTLSFSRDLENATRDIQQAESLIESASQLQQIGVETTLFQELRAQDQWQRKVTAIRAEISRMAVTAPGEQAQLRSIGNKVDLLQTIYARMSAAPALGSVGGIGDGAARTVASLLVVTQEIIDIAHELIQGNRQDGARAMRNLQLSVLLMIVTMAVFVTFVWRLVSRRILQPLRVFEESTKQVASGNYAHRLNLQQSNEVGALADAFDAMTDRVERTTQEITAHRDSLSHTVLEKTTELSSSKNRAETSAQYARSLIEASLDPLVTISAHGKITDVNDASVQATGVAREQLIGTDFSDYFTEPDKARLGYQRVFSEGLVRDYPLAIRHKNGDIKEVLYNAAVYKDGEGKVLGVFAAARDVTELSGARDRAETSAQYARSLIEASLDPLVTISAHGKITDVNDASVQATGVAREQLIGTDFSDYFTEPDKARVGYQRVFSEGLVRDYPLAIRHKNGDVKDVLYNAAVYKDGEGKVLGVFAAARDVTERLKLDRIVQENTVQLHNAMALAEKASQAKSNFLSSMSHELRTPLNAILGFAQLIDSDLSPPTASQKRSLDQILKGGWYLLELINEILDLTQIESGKIQLLLEPVALGEVMLESRAMIEPQALKRGIGLTFEQLDRPYFVDLDRTRLKQILINLLSNAVKYNRPGGSVTVEFSLRAPNAIRISVRDTGAGLTQHQCAQLFQSFNRLGKESGVEEGTGIGLVVTKRLVEMMGGAIGVKSVVGVGSVFWVEFKLIDAPQLALSGATPVALMSEQQARDGTRQRSLLYVEDNAANLDLVEQLIARRDDLDFLSAPDGSIGMEFAHTHLPAVILMDINLPGISGLDAMKLLRADPVTAHIPIIALSANALPRDIEGGRAAGFFDYLTKPIKVTEFMDAVDRALQFSEKRLTPVDAARG